MKKDQNDHGDNRNLKITINDNKYDWPNQYITGAEIRKVAHIPETDEIYLAVKKPWEDELITNETRVNLARPEVEHFFSETKEKEITIIVNGSPKKWDKKQISFVEVVILAYGTYVDSPTMVYTVAYEDGPRQNPEGSMVKGQVVFVKNKMIFHATATDKS